MQEHEKAFKDPQLYWRTVAQHVGAQTHQNGERKKRGKEFRLEPIRQQSNQKSLDHSQAPSQIRVRYVAGRKE